MAANKLAEPEGFDSLAGTQDISDDFLSTPEEKPAVKDPSMDPGSPLWNPRKYFNAQPKVVVTVKKTALDLLNDPKGDKRFFQSCSINGYRLEIEKGVPTRVPRDFALMLADHDVAHVEGSIADARELP